MARECSHRSSESSACSFIAAPPPHQLLFPETSSDDQEIKAPRKIAEIWIYDEIKALISCRKEMDAYPTSLYLYRYYSKLLSKLQLQPQSLIAIVRTLDYRFYRPATKKWL